MTPAAKQISDGLAQRSRDLGDYAKPGASMWQALDDFDHCHWPEGIHPFRWPIHRASLEERELGIPAGTFATIRRWWRADAGPIPPRYAEINLRTSVQDLVR